MATHQEQREPNEDGLQPATHEVQAKELHTALRRLEAIQKNAPLGIITTFNRLIIDCNDHFNQMFGFADGQAIGVHASGLFPSAEIYDELGKFAGPLLSNAKSVDLEIQMRRQSGDDFWAQLVGYVIDPNQPSAGTIWLIGDRTHARAQALSLQQALLENQAILDGAALGMVVLRDRVVLRCNPQAELMFGYAPNGMTGMATRAWYDTLQDYEWVGENMYLAMAQGEVVSHESILRKADGSVFWARMSGRTLGEGSPMSGATLWLFEDISAKRKTEEDLRAATVLNQVVFDSAGAAIIATDTQGLIQLFNTAAERMLGYTQAQMQLGQTPAIFHDEAEVLAYAQQLTNELGEEVVPGFDVFCIKARQLGKDEREWTYIAKDGLRFPVNLCVTALRSGAGEITGYLGIATDISERRRAQMEIAKAHQELETRVEERTAELASTNLRLTREVRERIEIERQVREMAHYDSVTGLPNRNLLRDRMEQALLQGQRSGESVAVMFLDLDRFKNINDTLGHLVGDALLRQVAVRLSMTLRTSDTLARLGGDEFVLILPGLAATHRVEVIAEKLVSALQAPLVVQEHALHITTSIGICIYPQDGLDTDVLLQNADTAMYQAKAAGRNTYRFFTEAMNREAERHYRIESALRVGIRDNELRLVYQPLVDMPSNRIFGVEALVRWHSPTQGIVPPNQFIGIAEETDLIVEIDSWVLRQACTQAALWRSQGLPDVTVAVNLSARQFRRTDLLSFVSDTLRETGYPAHLLELEITESCLMHNVGEVIETLHQLVELGVRLAIDDFGTGYSSLAYLKRFPVHKLKIDQSFVREIDTAQSDLGIVKTVIALAQTLQLDLLAEGVETQAHLMTLRALGCQRFQGYLFSKPLPPEQMETLLTQSVTSLLG
jgi:diguanylate cyclase (GGDEF)-like protein/PAS domain S-box-containing protein